jgi:hypothetical protein
MFVNDVARRRDYFDIEIMRRDGSIYSIDHSFKVICATLGTNLYKLSKHISQINGQKIFEGLFTCKNEYAEIRMQHLVG